MVVLKGPSFVVLSKLSLLGAGVLGHSLGSLRTSHPQAAIPASGERNCPGLQD